ncbi:hypothetical protein FOXYS1_5895 [Fusarium oxysporum]|uniref:Heterokaryon incompatibility domain-containing protein n=1 Tax=Fusarium oxysporum TaxID=5507 RepID=A0A8H5EJX4_FUSOX|nr:hypothetical protein FOXYS1_5895 [Fusarium oxysporum]
MTRVVLCKFGKDKKLSRHEVELGEHPFIAISHVWCQATWRSIPGIEWRVLASPQKARWIADELPLLVQDDYFWMDILAIDQADKAKRIAIVDHIPSIYRQAKLTLVVREDSGLQACCENVLPENTDVVKGSQKTIFNKEQEEIILKHFQEYHPEGVEEIWLNRLWPLQEVMMSDNLQFTVCRSTHLRDQQDSLEASISSLNLYDNGGAAKVERLKTEEKGVKLLRPLFESLHSLAEAWVDQGLYVFKSGKDQDALADAPWEKYAFLQVRFVSAMINNSTVSRPTERYAGHLYSPHNVLSSESQSRRKTTKPRDFVLAIFPQFEWYQKPDKATQMAFGEIFADATKQWQRSITENHELHSTDRSRDGKPSPWVNVHARVPAGLTTPTSTESRSFEPSIDLPTPAWFGDFVKLFTFTEIVKPTLHKATQSTWSLRAIDKGILEDKDLILKALGHTIWFGNYSYWNDFEDHYVEISSAKAETEEKLRRLRSRLEELENEICPDEVLEIQRRVAELEQNISMFPNPDVATALVYIHEVWRQTRITFGEASDNIMSGRDQQLRMQGGISYTEDNWWELQREIFSKFDSPSFRSSLILATTVIACGLGISALKWAEGRFKVMELSLRVPGVNLPGFPARQTLVLTAKDLEVEPEDYIQAYTTQPETWITVRSVKDPVQTRVVGICPPPSRFHPAGLNMGLHNGVPLATIWPKAQVAEEVQRSKQGHRRTIRENPSQLTIRQIADLIRRQRVFFGKRV